MLEKWYQTKYGLVIVRKYNGQYRVAVMVINGNKETLIASSGVHYLPREHAFASVRTQLTLWKQGLTK